MFNHWLVKEPVTQNPFELVYSVVRYTIIDKRRGEGDCKCIT